MIGNTITIIGFLMLTVDCSGIAANGSALAIVPLQTQKIEKCKGIASNAVLNLVLKNL